MTRLALISRDGLDQLIRTLRGDGFTVVGPSRRDGAIVYDEIDSIADLPAGWTDEHAPGRYRLRRRDDEALFGYVVGPHSWKNLLHSPRRRLWRCRRSDGRIEVIPDIDESPKYAFVGVRSCDLHAIEIQDRVFVADAYRDEVYQARRAQAFVVAVNCVEARQHCFCVSMGTGPRAGAGFDLALTELLEPARHVFLVEVGSDRGAQVLDAIDSDPATDADLALAHEGSRRAASQMGRSLDTRGLKELLQSNPEHPRWDEVASRCLTCANCTMVCPTCFCTSVEDRSDLDGEHAERWLRWDSCFNVEYSHIHGGSVRTSAKARYRQWMTHKLAHWFDQFGSSGCVGCGRCISWCPVGIDITEEAAAIRASAGPGDEKR